MRRKIIIIFILSLIVAFGIYLNRAYAHIYNKIAKENLKAVNQEQIYIINNFDNLKKKFTYVALGDSLTSGVGVNNYTQSYPFLIIQKLSQEDKKYILSNRSYPGARSSDLLNNLLNASIKDQPDIITLLIGINDIHGNVSFSEFKENYENILSRLVSETKSKIYLINLPFIGADNLILPPYNLYFDLQTKNFNKIIKTLADKYQVKYIDLYSPTVDQFKKSGPHYSADLFHPSAQGYAIWAQIIYDNINK